MRKRDGWFDYRGGVNTTFSPDVLDKTELVQAENMRLTTYGALSKRKGTQRIHSDDLGADILGLVQWDNPSQSAELVAIAAGDLWHKTLAATTWTNVASTLSTTNRVSFAPYKASGTNRLYFGDGALRKWTATTLTTSIAGAPSATFLAVYKERMFAIDGTDQTIYWSKINDPETWASPNGGQAFVETYDSEPIVGMATVGSSLLIFKEDSIARFTGTTNTTINIDKGTEGVSPDVGCIAPGTIVRVDDFVFFLSDRGPYIANEGGVRPIGMKIESQLASWDRSNWTKAWAVHNKDAREIELHVPISGNVNDVAWVWNMRADAWTGPWDRGFNVQVACPFERTDGTEGILLGGDDNFIRDGDNNDNGYLDDVLSDDSGGSNFTSVVEWPPFFFGDPGSVKILQATQYLMANLGAAGSVVMTGSGGERNSTSTFTISTTGAAVDEYRFHLAWRGRRPTLKLNDGSTSALTINGLVIEAEIGRRVV